MDVLHITVLIGMMSINHTVNHTLEKSYDRWLQAVIPALDGLASGLPRVEDIKRLIPDTRLIAMRSIVSPPCRR